MPRLSIPTHGGVCSPMLANHCGISMEQQTPVVFKNRKGMRLFGMLHTPTVGARKDIGVLLLSPGVKMRLGPQCLYRRITDLFVQQGFTVFRFDFFGIGDSEGDIAESALVDFYNHIEVGRYVDDALDALDWMQKHCGVSRVIATGLCGGAVTGLLAGDRDNRVAALLGLGITPVLASKAANASAYMTVGELKTLRRGYFKNLASFTSWWRLLTFQSDYKLIWRSLMKPLLQKRTTPSVTSEALPASAEADNSNPLFAPAFFKMLGSRRPILLVFSGADRLYAEFQEKFLSRHGERLRAISTGYDVHVVPNANHVLSLREWEQEMLDVSARWLEKTFPREASAGAVAA